MRKQARYRLAKASPLAKLIIDIGNDGKHSERDVFMDFISTAAYALSNQNDLASPNWREREDSYMAIVRRYTPDQVHQFPKMLGELQKSLRHPDKDAIGRLAGDMEVLNKGMGQFFTPFTVSQMMATIVMHDTKEKIAADGFITVMDPCCGAGGMLIAAAGALEAKDIDYRTAMHASAVDIDIHCVHMTYVQLSLLGIPAVVTHGDSLRVQYHSHWFTPAHIAGNWSSRLAQQDRAEKDRTWWNEFSVETRVAFLKRHELKLDLALNPRPTTEVIEAREAEVVRAEAAD